MIATATRHHATGINMHPIRPLHRPNPATIARRQAIRALILETLGSVAAGAVLFFILFA